MDYLPSWTTPGHWSLGRDPLGMQATSVRMYRRLVPGLTNVTNRLRYYALYAFLVDRFAAHDYAQTERWGHFIRRAEALYALSCNIADTEGATGLAGNKWARALLKKPYGEIFEAGRLDLTRYTDELSESEQYLSNRRSNFGQFYIASMLEECFLSKSKGAPLIAPRGQACARAFAASIGKAADIFIDASRQGSVAASDIILIGESMHPSRIPADSEELSLLRAFATGEGARDGPAFFRRESGRLALRLCRARGEAFDDHAFRNALYNETLPDGARFRASGPVADLWCAYQANELCHIALEAILNAIVRTLGARGGTHTPDQLTTLTLGPALDEIGKAITGTFGQGERDTSFAEFALTLGYDAIGRETEIAERILAVTGRKEADRDGVVVADAISLLAALYVRWNGDVAMRGLVDEFTLGGRGRSIIKVLATLDKLADTPAREALTILVRRHVVLEHLLIAGRKLAAKRPTFTYRFTSTDGVLDDGRRTIYTYTNPRLTNLMRFLEDAGLHNGGILTPVGDAFLDDEPIR